MTVTWVLGSTPPGNFIKRIKYPKAPADTVPVTLDFSGAIAAIDGDTIASITSSVVVRNDGTTADLSITSGPTISLDLSRLTVWLSSGTAGFEYMITLTVVTLLGQTIARSFILPVYLR